MTTSLLAAAHRGGVVLADVTINPNGGGAPGGQQLGQIINYIAFYALLACAAGFLASSIVWHSVRGPATTAPPKAARPE